MRQARAGCLPIEDVPAVILAGGRGERLRSEVPGQKVVAPVAGRPFLAFLLDQLAATGFRQIAVAAGYRADEVKHSLCGRPGKLHITIHEEREVLGTGGAVAATAALSRSPRYLVMNGDSYFAADLGRFYADHVAAAASVSMLLTAVADSRRFGRVAIGESGDVLAFHEKDSDFASPALVNAGIYLFEEAALAQFPSTRPLSLERDVLPRFVGRGLRGVHQSGAFIDIGLPESYRAAARFFAAPLSRP